MTETLPDVAVKNPGLLRAIAAGPHNGLGSMADAAGMGANNINRSLDRLAEAGLTAKTGDASYQVELTEAGRRALAALDLFAGNAEPAAVGAAQIGPRRILFSGLNPRTQYDPEAIEDLARSIADKGLLQAVLVRPAPDLDQDEMFELVLGERRLRACRHAMAQGWVPPDFTIPVRIETLTDEQVIEITGVENLQREDMHWMDEAEWYLRLTLPPMNRSAGAIERLVGKGGRRKRSIQELIQFARELDAAAKDRARLPREDRQHLSVEQCRFLVGNKRERPALDLTPKLACALIELIDAADIETDALEFVTTLHARPVPGPLITLSDRGLIRFKFEGAAMFAVTPQTDDLTKWLGQLNYYTDITVVRRLRAAVIGDLRADTIPKGRYLTPELNAPEIAAAPPEHDDTSAPAPHPEAPAQRASKDAQAPKPAPKPLGQYLPPEKAVVLFELARKITIDGVERPGGIWAAPVRPDHYKDRLAQDMIYDRLLMFMPVGPTPLAAITPRGEDWLRANAYDADTTRVDEQALVAFYAANGLEDLGDRYHTAWLNDGALADTIEETTPAIETAHPGERRDPDPMEPAEDADPEDDGYSPITGGDPDALIKIDAAPASISPTPISPTLVRHMANALRDAAHAVRNAGSRKLKPEEVRQITVLAEALIDDANRALATQPQEA